MQAPQDISPIHSGRYSRSRIFQEEEIKGTVLDKKLEHVRVTADFSAAGSNEGLQMKLSSEGMKGSGNLYRGELDFNSRVEHEKPNENAMKIGPSELSEAREYAFERRTAKFEGSFGQREQQRFSQKEQVTRADSETDPTTSTEIHSKKDTRASRADREISRYYEDFGFRESECFDRNHGGLSFI